MPSRIIAHLDMDAFFAAIEERNNLQFKGLPIVVGADPKEGRGRGVVSTANYKARKYGIRSAMPISQAWRLSEAARHQGKSPAIFVGGSFRRYIETSKKIMEFIYATSPTVQVRSIDEAYFDLTFTKSYENAQEVCKDLKNKIYKQEQLTASVGIGPNKLIAKIASDYNKPDGLTSIEEKDVQDFLVPLSIRAIPGIGPKTEILLRQQGIRTIGDAQKISREQLKDMLGKWGIELHRKVRGRDSSPVTEHEEIKSISEQTTFEVDTLDAKRLFNQLNKLCKGVFERLRQEKCTTFKTITVTARFADFETHTYTHTLPKPAYSITALQREAVKLLLPYLDARKNSSRKLIRLIGVRLQKLH